MISETVSWIELIWVIAMTYGTYKTARIWWRNVRVRHYWEPHEGDRAFNGRTDIYTADQVRSSTTRMVAIVLLLVAGITAMTIPPSGVDRVVEPAYVAYLPALFILAAGLLIVWDASSSDAAQVALLEYSEDGTPKMGELEVDALCEANKNV